MNPKRIVIDGKAYNSVDDMPEDVRRNYEEAITGFNEMNPSNVSSALDDLKNMFADKNNNGTPDIFEGGQVINLAGGMKFIVDGKTYKSLDELPPEARAKYEHAMSVMDQNQNGTPDFLERRVNANVQSQPVQPDYPNRVDTTRPAPRSPLPGSPTITPDTSNGFMLALAVLAVLFLCAAGAAGIWYFFLR